MPCWVVADVASRRRVDLRRCATDRDARGSGGVASMPLEVEGRRVAFPRASCRDQCDPDLGRPGDRRQRLRRRLRVGGGSAASRLSEDGAEQDAACDSQQDSQPG